MHTPALLLRQVASTRYVCDCQASMQAACLQEANVVAQRIGKQVGAADEGSVPEHPWALRTRMARQLQPGLTGLQALLRARTKGLVAPSADILDFCGRLVFKRGVKLSRAGPLDGPASLLGRRPALPLQLRQGRGGLSPEPDQLGWCRQLLVLSNF